MKLRKNIAISEAGLLFNPVTGESFSVNPIGVDLLKMIQTGKTQQDICDSLLEKYSTDRTTIENDYQDFIDLLSHNHLIERHEEKDA
jgi:Coenzyme PQQ synthesis protein D (PqqD)